MEVDAGHKGSPAAPRGARDLPAVLAEAAEVFAGLGEAFVSHRERLETSAARLSQNELRVAVVGQFKRGKSTLLNALLGEEVLPSAVLPLTSVPTLLRGADTRRMEVEYRDGRPPERREFEDANALRAALEECVTERENPENEKGVDLVTVSHPAPVLSSGIVLVDTPGIGSTFRHNTRTTESFLPECDAALFVVSPDPPMTEVETNFLRSLLPGAVRLFVVLNKIDTVGAPDREELVDFLTATLEGEVDLPEVPIHCVSARDGLAARSAGGRDGNGIAELESRILRPLSQEKSGLLAEAIRRKVDVVLAEGLSAIRLAERALTLPAAELDARLGELAKRTAEVRDQARFLRDLIGAERKRALEFLESRAEELGGRARAHLRELLERTFGDASREADLRDVVAEAVPAFFAREHDALTDAVRDHLAGALRPYQERAEKLVAQIARAAEEVFEVPVPAPDSGVAYQVAKAPCWSTARHISGLTEVPPEWVDAVLPRVWRQRRVRKRLCRDVDRLVVRNVENLRWATFQSIGASVDGFLGALGRHLEAVERTTEGAVARGRARRDDGADAIREEVARLRAAATRLTTL